MSIEKKTDSYSYDYNFKMDSNISFSSDEETKSQEELSHIESNIIIPLIDDVQKDKKILLTKMLLIFKIILFLVIFLTFFIVFFICN